MPFIKIDPAAATVIAGGPYGVPLTSGLKSLADLRSDLAFDLGNRTDLGPANYDRWINDAYVDMASSADIPESKVSLQFDVVVGQPFYKLPSGLGRAMRGAMYSTGDEDEGWKLEHRDVDYWRMLPNNTGAPRMFAKEQNVIVLWPTPDAAYTIVLDMKIEPVKLTLTTDYPIFANEYHEPLLKLARAKAWESLQNDEKALTSEGSASRVINRKQSGDDNKDQPRHASLRPVFTSRGLRQLRGGEDDALD